MDNRGSIDNSLVVGFSKQLYHGRLHPYFARHSYYCDLSASYFWVTSTRRALQTSGYGPETPFSYAAGLMATVKDDLGNTVAAYLREVGHD